MKRTRWPVLGVVTVMLMACGVYLGACSSSSSSQGSGVAAEDGLTILEEMADANNYADFGYASEADVASSELGEPFEVKMVDVAALLASATPTDEMIISDDEYLFPVLVGETPVESVRVSLMEDGSWDFISVESNAEIVAALAAIAAHGLDREECYLLNLEEVELFFVGYESDNRQMLIPLFATGSTSIVAGTAYAFTAIAEELKAEIVASQTTYASMVPPDDAEASIAPAAPIAASTSAAKASGNVNNRLSVPLFGQEQDQWCWAATGAMTMIYAGGAALTPPQCTQANSARSLSTCCIDGSTAACNQENYPHYRTWGYSALQHFSDSGASLTWEAFKASIDGGYPVAFLWKWTASEGAHYMVAYGYSENVTTGRKMVHIMDPLPVGVGTRKSVTYDAWVGGPWYDALQTGYYYNIVKN